MKKISIIFIITLLLIAATVNADTYFYPDEYPVFAVTFPDDWMVETDEELLSATPDDESIYVGIWALEDIDDIDAAMEALDEEIQDFMTDIIAKEPVITTINEIPFVIIDGKGVYDEDVPVEFSVTIFSTDGETFFIGLYFGEPDDINFYSEELKAIISSVAIPE